MARIVTLEATQPTPVIVGTETKWICACGLSKNKPFCDGTHKACKTEESGKVYRYNLDGTRTEVS